LDAPLELLLPNPRINLFCAPSLFYGTFITEFELVDPNGNLDGAANPLPLPLGAPKTIEGDYLLRLVSGEAIAAVFRLFLLKDDWEVELFRGKPD